MPACNSNYTSSINHNWNQIKTRNKSRCTQNWKRKIAWNSRKFLKWSCLKRAYIWLMKFFGWKKKRNRVYRCPRTEWCQILSWLYIIGMITIQRFYLVLPKLSLKFASNIFHFAVSPWRCWEQFSTKAWAILNKKFEALFSQ